MTISQNDQPGGPDPSPAEVPGPEAAGRSFRRIAFASFIGSVIEAYDFVLYSLAAALVFPKVFFPSLGPAAGTVASLATLGVAFVARPIGAVLFGHLGDRLGRKRTLIWTVLGMGLGTSLMGLIPSAATIGVAAPILIVVLRFVQGLAIGGEWAGAVLFVTEHAPPKRRGLYALFPQLGASLPAALSPATYLVVGLLVSPETFLSWGWRVPFVASFVLVVVALYIRLRVEETPIFKEEAAKAAAAAPPRPPLFESFRTQPWIILRASFVALTTLTFVYVGQSFVANYGVENLGLTRNQVFAASAIAGLFYPGLTVVSAVLSDRIGRRRLIVTAGVLGAIWAIVLFPLLNIGSVVVYAIALAVTFAIAGLPYGAVGAFLPEQFPTRYRYTAAGVSYQLAGVIGGGIAPLVAPVIVASAGSLVFGVVLAVLNVAAALGAYSLKDRSKESMRWNDGAQAATPRAATAER